MIPPDRLNYREPISFERFPLAGATARGGAIRDHPQGRPNEGAGEIRPVSLALGSAPELLMIVLFLPCAPARPRVHPTWLLALFLLELLDLACTSTHRTTVFLCFKRIASIPFEYA